MKSFEHVNATSLASATRMLGGSARPIAGGTDLLSELKLGIIAPGRLVNLKTVPGLADIRFDEVDGLSIGALTTLSTLAGNVTVREKYPVLALAVTSAASPQLRNSATLGGSLCQDSRCWYYRGAFRCWLKGGETCYARDGENAHHAIFGEGPCYTVHPSDPATALIALGAKVTTSGPDGERTFPLERLLRTPSERHRRLVALRPGEVLTAVHVPPPVAGGRGTYLKAMPRRAWAFALASVAVQVELDDGTVKDLRLVLGGVANTPWRVAGTEALRGRRLDEEAIGEAAELAASGAKPLVHNGYKIPLVKGIVREALMSLA